MIVLNLGYSTFEKIAFVSTICSLSISEKKAGHEYEIDLIDLKLFLQTEDLALKANAAGYIQHLCYNDDNIKAKIRYFPSHNYTLFSC